MIIICLTFVNDVFLKKVNNPFLTSSILQYLQWAIPTSLFLIITLSIMLLSNPL